MCEKEGKADAQNRCRQAEPERRDNVAGADSWLVGGGEMGKVIRSMDWSKTPLGPIESWPQSLRTTVSLCLATNFPISLAWGPKHVQIYNDGYVPICGAKHPGSMGQDFRECWASAMPVIGEAYNRAVAGETSYLENQRMFLDRNGYLEETFFTFSFSPIRDETGGVGGLFHPATETTPKMLAERRTRALRDLAASTGKAKTVDEALTVSAQVLATYDLDLPFVLLYDIEDGGNVARLVGCSGMPPGTRASPQSIDLNAPDTLWPLSRVINPGVAVKVDDLKQRLGDFSCGPYPEAPNVAMVLPILVPGSVRPVGMFIAGVSSRLPFNDMYSGFLEQLAATVSAAVANARAYEEERERAEKLAEIDRAKTLFFSNVSHEFRTPLTLMLGPLDDMLAQPEEIIDSKEREQLLLMRRNGLRLLKLVNTLLDFSRIEAGRIQASYEPTDLSTLTADLGSVFRSAVEKAGLTLTIDCPSLPEPVYVDREMWEKIVLNLLSNAFKFTFEGGITVSLRWCDDHVELTVKDTGIGVAPEEMPRLFERFHRIPGVRARTHEGSGIGLALVQELVKLHGGNITATSTPGMGTTFIVSIPTGSVHFPQDRISAARTQASTGTGAAPFIEEAKRWLPDDVPDTAVIKMGNDQINDLPEAAVPGTCEHARILLADDNSDMRNYIRRLLSDYYEVESVADGAAALAAAKNLAPDLVLSDVMMPGLGGFELLRELRADPVLRSVPVILLSARAGEESRIEGLQAGADDYLIKPFSARELIAKIGSHLEISRLRHEVMVREQELQSAAERKRAEEALRESEERFRALADNIPNLAWMANPDGYIFWYNKQWYDYTGTTLEEMQGWGWQKVHHPDYVKSVTEEWSSRIKAGLPYDNVFPLRGKDGEYRWFLTRVTPIRDEHGNVQRWFGTNTDITERKRAEEERDRVFNYSMDLLCIVGFDGIKFTRVSPSFKKILGWSEQELVNRPITDFIHPDDQLSTFNKANEQMDGALAIDFENQYLCKDGSYKRISWNSYPVVDERIIICVGRDITERKQAEDEVREAKIQAELYLDLMGHDISNMHQIILGQLEMAEEIIGVEGKIAGDNKELIDTSIKNLKRSARLIDNVKKLQQLQAGEYSKEPVDLGQVLEDAVATYSSVSEKKVIIRYIPERGQLIRVNPLIREVFNNLLDNAVKHSGDPVRIGIAVDRVERNGCRYHRVAIEDNGPGIPDEKKSEVFNRLNRGHTKARGTGLGLYIVKTLVESFDGIVEVEDRVKGDDTQGSRFVVYLPFIEDGGNGQ